MENEKEIKETDLKVVDVEIAGEIVLPTFDTKPYIGKESPIIAYQVMQGKYGYCVEIKTDTLGTYKFKNEERQVYAKRLFGLQMDDHGAIGWGRDTNLGLFLKKYGATTLKDLVGKVVLVQSKQSKKDGKDYLTIV